MGRSWHRDAASAPSALLAVLTSCALVACTTSAESDAGTEDATIEAGSCGHLDYAALAHILPDRSCTDDSNCVGARYAYSCCPGALRWRGVTTADEGRFSAEIASCERGIDPPDCGCAGYPEADDGTRGDSFPVTSAEVHCVDHQCTTTFPGSTLCGTGACSPSLVCVPSCVVAPDGAVTGESTPSCQYVYPCDGGECTPCNGGTSVRLTDGGFSCTCP